MVVLEGRNRLGGRVWTSHLDDDIHVDIGGAWLQYPDTNPVAKHLEGVQRLETPQTSMAVYLGRDGETAPQASPEEIQ